MTLEICRQCRRKLEEELLEPGEKTVLATPEVLLPLLEETTTRSSVTQPLPTTTTAGLEGNQEPYHSTDTTQDTIRVRTSGISLSLKLSLQKSNFWK